jgi:hypothetical protein
MKKANYFRIFATIFMFSANISLYAQLNDSYVNGTIELRTGEKIKGLIRNDELGKTTFGIKFKSLISSEKFTVYDTSQLKGFSFDNGNSYELLYMKGRHMDSTVAVFAKLLVKGKASLYKLSYYLDIIYIITNETKLYVLQEDKLGKGANPEFIQYYFKNYLSSAFAGSTISDKELENIKFSEKQLAAIVVKYNQSLGEESKVVATKQKPIHFVGAFAGGMIAGSNKKEYFFQAYYRTFFPEFSRGTSFNIGVNYFNYKSNEIKGTGLYATNKTYTRTLFSIPFEIQQNFLNKNIRPYAIAGFSASYFKVVDEEGTSQLRKGFENNMGIGLIFGAGIEAKIYKGLTFKTEYRNQVISHLVLAGLGYNFSIR